MNVENVANKGGNYFINEPNLDVSGNPVTASGVNIYLKQHYFYDCIVPLKQLPFFDKMPLVRGANIKMTFNLNQGKVEYKDAGTASLNVKGSIFPALRF